MITTLKSFHENELQAFDCGNLATRTRGLYRRLGQNQETSQCPKTAVFLESDRRHRCSSKMSPIWVVVGDFSPTTLPLPFRR
jgi:hypothetical protein